jgi:transcriptional regulator with XRE-family HTH domain
VKNIIPYIRRQKGIKQNILSSALGVSASYLCKIESGALVPSKKFMENCSKYLETPIDEIFPKKRVQDKVNECCCEFSNKLWSTRKRKGILQTELARKLECSPSYLSKIEKGKQKPTDVFRKKCAKILKVRENELFPTTKV